MKPGARGTTGMENAPSHTDAWRESEHALDRIFGTRARCEILPNIAYQMHGSAYLPVPDAILASLGTALF